MSQQPNNPGVLMFDDAWSAQSQSLVRVQQEGGKLEKLVQSILGWKGGRIVYDARHKYDIQTDAIYPSAANPQVVVSVTYTSPDTPGHSNENKFQLKLGELALLKCAHPDIRVVLVIGGIKAAWLSYVLEAFQYFYDEVLFLWEPEGVQRLKEISRDPTSVQPKHLVFWADMSKEWQQVPLVPESYVPPNCSIRYDVADALKAQRPVVYNPSLIENEIARACMRESFNRSGTEWQSYLQERWFRIEMSRNYFNPVEAVIQLSLEKAQLAYEGGIARDVDVPSLLHDLGMHNTRVSEDFVLYSDRFQAPVYIQSKSSGGGRQRHGKNIQNRTKEQVARGILYRCRLIEENVAWLPKQYIWISVLDGNWGVSRRQPLKYIHMLQMAGYDQIFAASDLVTSDLGVRHNDNPLISYLVEYLRCQPITTS